ELGSDSGLAEAESGAHALVGHAAVGDHDRIRLDEQAVGDDRRHVECAAAVPHAAAGTPQHVDAARDAAIAVAAVQQAIARLVDEPDHLAAVGDGASGARRLLRRDAAVLLKQLAVTAVGQTAASNAEFDAEPERARAVAQRAVGVPFDERFCQLLEDNGHQYVISRYPSATGSSESTVSENKSISVTCAPVPSIGLHAPSS